MEKLNLLKKKWRCVFFLSNNKIDDFRSFLRMCKKIFWHEANQREINFHLSRFMAKEQMERKEKKRKEYKSQKRILKK